MSRNHSISARTSRAIPLRLGSLDASKVTRKGVQATASLSERGIKGARTVRRSVTAKR